ncbi:MAG: DUF3408 domain-containing protein [Janthinobacterium lividum]
MATAKKDTAKAPDSQAQMTNFVQAFARPATPAPAALPPAAEPTSEVAAELEEPIEAAQPAAETDEVAESQSTSGKKKVAAPVVDENASWAESYLQPVRNRKTKAIYVDEETHATLALLTHEAGVGLADLLINITNNHFDTYRQEIREFLAERERLKKKKSRF